MMYSYKKILFTYFVKIYVYTLVQSETCETDLFGDGTCKLIENCPSLEHKLRDLTVRDIESILCPASEGPNAKICCPPQNDSQPSSCGLETAFSKHPWLVELGNSHENKFQMLCAGVLVSSKHIIGGVECVKDATHVKIEVDNRSKDDEEILELKESVAHQNWDKLNPIENNIAIYKLKHDIPTNSKARTICLSFVKRDYSNLLITKFDKSKIRGQLKLVPNVIKSHHLPRDNCPVSSSPDKQICTLHPRSCGKTEEVSPILTTVDAETKVHSVLGVGFQNKECVPGLFLTVSKAVTFSYIPTYESWILRIL